MIFKSLDTDPLIPSTDPDLKHWCVVPNWLICTLTYCTCPTLEIDVLYTVGWFQRQAPLCANFTIRICPMLRILFARRYLQFSSSKFCTQFCANIGSNLQTLFSATSVVSAVDRLSKKSAYVTTFASIFVLVYNLLKKGIV